MSTVTVETHSRWETSSLLRKLRGRAAYAVQLDQRTWVVRSVGSDSVRALAEMEALVAEWAHEEGTRVPVVYLEQHAPGGPVQ